jgi:hypothetical protein
LTIASQSVAVTQSAPSTTPSAPANLRVVTP